MTRLENAIDLATLCHHRQFRKYMEEMPYIIHPIRVMAEVSKYINDVDVLAAAVCHDLLEDTTVTLDVLEARIGERATRMVQALTNVSKGSSLPRADRKALDRQHLFEVITDSEDGKWIRLIKTIDRIDNLDDMVRTCDKKDFMSLYADESLLLWDVLKNQICYSKSYPVVPGQQLLSSIEAIKNKVKGMK